MSTLQPVVPALCLSTAHLIAVPNSCTVVTTGQQMQHVRRGYNLLARTRAHRQVSVAIRGLTTLTAVELRLIESKNHSIPLETWDTVTQHTGSLV